MYVKEPLKDPKRMKFYSKTETTKPKRNTYNTINKNKKQPKVVLLFIMKEFFHNKMGLQLL